MHTNPEVLALVALGEHESATAEDLHHIAHCPSCGREVTELGHLSQVGRTISEHYTLEVPSPQVWERIRAQLGVGDDFSSPLMPASTGLTPQPEPALGRAPDDPARPPSPIRSRRRPVALALAAVLVLLAGVGGVLAWQRLQGPGAVVTATPLNALPAWAGATGEVTFERDADGRQWLEISMETPRPVDGEREVWLMSRDATTMTSIGVMKASDDRLEVPSSIDVHRYPVVDVSDEQPDGPASHSGDSIVRGTLDV